MTKIPPISQMPKSKPKVANAIFYGSALFFAALEIWIGVSLVAIQCLAFLLLMAHYPLLLLPIDKESTKLWFYQQYKAIIRLTEEAFGVGLLVLASILIPKSKLVLSGEHEALKDVKNAILISNHQIYPDWVYLWLLARRYNRHGDLQIMLIAELQYIPLFGLGMKFFGFIFMQRKLALDRDTIINAMEHQRKYFAGFPHWLLLFPEGTLNTPVSRAVSDKYAEKVGIENRPEYVLIPKATGLFMAADALTEDVDYLYDLTVGYSGLKEEEIPYEEYLIENVFFSRKYPKEIHIHVRRYKLQDIPGVRKPDEARAIIDKNNNFDAESDIRRTQFSNWLMERFMEKDIFMKNFYENKKFDDTSLSCDVALNAYDIGVLGLMLGSSLFTIPLFYRAFFTLFSIIFYWK